MVFQYCRLNPAIVAAAFASWLIASEAAAGLEVHFIDVGQGDAILLMTPDAAVLVDGGEANGVALDYLRRQGVERLDLMVATHAHADHIGGLTQVIASEAVTVDRLWYNGQPHTTVTFEGFVDAVLAQPGIRYREPLRGDTQTFGSLALSVLHPIDETTAAGDLHDHMIVVKVTYGDVALMLTGDAEHPVEARILADGGGAALGAGLIKLGHHGSRTSTSEAFLNAVGPQIAVYQAGAGNRYGHPSNEVIERLVDRGVAVYGTDSHGALVVETDGRTWSMIASAPMPEETCVDLNAAGRDRLLEIAHIGEARVTEVINNRPYNAVADLARVPGLGPARIADIAEQGQACLLAPGE